MAILSLKLVEMPSVQRQSSPLSGLSFACKSGTLCNCRLENLSCRRLHTNVLMFLNSIFHTQFHIQFCSVFPMFSILKLAAVPEPSWLHEGGITWMVIYNIALSLSSCLLLFWITCVFCSASTAGLDFKFFRY